jgi:hypothetical protein
MNILLFKNGQGVVRAECARIVSDTIKLSFVGAPAFAVLSIIGETRTIRKHLNPDGTCEISVTDLLDGDTKFTVSSKGKIWYVDGIRVERDEDGNVYINSLADYADKLEKCFAEIDSLKHTVSEMHGSIEKLSADVERYKKDYQII